VLTIGVGFERDVYTGRTGAGAAMIEPDGPAPEFTLNDQDGNPVSLADYRGRYVVLYFYPKADTPGCTTQACGVRDRATEYAAANAVVLGVSPDPIPDLRAFADKHGLAFTLLSDTHHRVAERYGVWKELNLGGRVLWGNQRSTVLVNPLGNVARVFPEVKADEHDDLVLGALAEMDAVAGG
jgi:thioredoxin-dependent peroxiredoxin